MDDGFIVLGGPLADEVRVAHVIEAASEDAVVERLARDPWSGSHLVVASIEPWTLRLDGRAGYAQVVAVAGHPSLRAPAPGADPSGGV